MVNGIAEKDKIEDDNNGSITIKQLEKCLKITRLLNSNHPSSLGLHPAVYFYAKNGRHKPASFLATIDFVMELQKQKKFNEFTKIRKEFELFLVNYEDMIQQIVRKYRSSSASYPHIRDLYLCLMDLLANGKGTETAQKEILALPLYKYLTTRDLSVDDFPGAKFSSGQKSEIFMKEALEHATKCRICGGYIHLNSVSIDHIERKQDGGLSTIDNGQLTHPYCNTTYKN